ncbi:hypothetical protein [Streptacidiphilus sp. P02-A3a]|uniref:hypothetical protein n=1 Tax=Streptacidiphilus sp. P02-A3a TaxID=2704468 RepID=UPI0015FBB2AB|nr:hypothetical protein [Streptacidiphilus sp. P02-A3a]QMU67057.1 hypothetical protein GXP74_01350 [Streptacidiphilus sp. P02-A3a]
MPGPLSTSLLATSLLAAMPATPQPTVRSPLLYAWLALQAVVLLALLYGAYRLVRGRRERRRPR